VNQIKFSLFSVAKLRKHSVEWMVVLRKSPDEPYICIGIRISPASVLLHSRNDTYNDVKWGTESNKESLQCPMELDSASYGPMRPYFDTVKFNRIQHIVGTCLASTESDQPLQIVSYLT